MLNIQDEMYAEKTEMREREPVSDEWLNIEDENNAKNIELRERELISDERLNIEVEMCAEKAELGGGVSSSPSHRRVLTLWRHFSKFREAMAL